MFCVLFISVKILSVHLPLSVLELCSVTSSCPTFSGSFLSVGQYVSDKSPSERRQAIVST